ncbi:GspH/FimT family pseudopilin [Hydrogenophaga taeniospiralis]|nr:GspH/FimT family protein [Hydrogenophaga taeniospiralis]
MKLNAARGVTALELIVVLSVVAILAALALPSWQELSNAQRRWAVASQLSAHLALARSAAISRGRSVALSPRGQGWSGGWRVYLDSQPNGQWDTDESILAEHEGDALISIAGNGTMGRYILFNPDGRPVQTGGGFLAGTLQLCVPETRGVTALIMNAAGRIREERRDRDCVTRSP